MPQAKEKRSRPLYAKMESWSRILDISPVENDHKYIPRRLQLSAAGSISMIDGKMGSTMVPIHTMDTQDVNLIVSKTRPGSCKKRRSWRSVKWSRWQNTTGPSNLRTAHGWGAAYNWVSITNICRNRPERWSWNYFREQSTPFWLKWPTGKLTRKKSVQSLHLWKTLYAERLLEALCIGAYTWRLTILTSHKTLFKTANQIWL